MTAVRRGLFLPVLCWVLLLSSSRSATGQVVPLYDAVLRPPGVSYSVLRGIHFEIIFERGLRSQADEMLHVLESTLAGTDSLTGTRRSTLHMSVVLNRTGDRGNGFVTTFPFKQEIEATAIKGRGLSRLHPDWISVVSAHELVHASQAEFRDGIGITGIVYPFSPDFARSLNMFTPPGILEGVAVYRESKLTPGAGRLNHPFFTMQFRAAFEDGKGWTLAQMLESPAFSRPFDRFYEGGSHLVDYLDRHYGLRIVQSLARWQYRIPFLGFGINLWQATGKPPWRFGSDMRQRIVASEKVRIESLGPIRIGQFLTGEEGTVYRRPLWLTDSTLLVFAVGYNLRRGFFSIDVSSGNRVRELMTTITEDVPVSLSTDGSKIYYSRYDTDRFVQSLKTAGIYQYDRIRDEIRLLSQESGLLAPVRTADNRILALQNRGQFTTIVEIDDTGRSRNLIGDGRAEFISLIPHPSRDTLAAIVNIRGHQALFWVQDGRELENVLIPWIGFEGATIYDAAWSRDGSLLVFTSDRGGVLNVYVADPGSGKIWKATNVPYAAMEGALSPAGDMIAFVEYRDQEFDLRTIPFRPEARIEVDPAEARFTQGMPWKEWLKPEPEYYSRYRSWNYNSLTYLRPRMLYPTVYLDSPRRKKSDARLGLGLGAAVQGTDPLQRWAYYGEGIVRKSRFWGEAGFQWGAGLLQPTLRVFNRPQTLTRNLTSGGTLISSDRFIRERFGVSLGVQMPMTLMENVSRTTLNPFIDLNYRSEQFLDDDLEALTDRTRRLTLSPGIIYGYRVIKNARDLVPNSGLVLRVFSDIDLTTTGQRTERGTVGLMDLYLPLLEKLNTGIHVQAAVLDQNVPSIFNLDFFLPRGLEDAAVPAGTFMRYALTIRQPILFVDNGTMFLPIFLKAVYLYGFGEYVKGIERSSPHFEGLGFGAGFQFRLLSFFDFDLKIGRAYLPGEARWETIYR